MSIRVALQHRTTYAYDRLVNLGAQLVRLRPAPHARTPVLSYSLKVEPTEHFINWQQDPFGNFMARLVFPKPTRRLAVCVDLIADMTVINPFDFFVEPAAEAYPFTYEPWLARELEPYLDATPLTPGLKSLLDSLPASAPRTVDFLVSLNRLIWQRIGYVIRMEPGVQEPQETLTLGKGSCRDSAWLLVNLLRHLGLAARFVSGYLIQLTPDVKSLDGPSGTSVDFTDLHAWTEVYLPGAGWIGLDPTSGLLTGEGHIPLAATPTPMGAAPISGAVDESEVEFDFAMSVTRIHEDPRVTKPYTPQQWQRIVELGHRVDDRLRAEDVRLTVGGEPTFVSIDDMDAPQWNTQAVGEDKRRLSDVLIRRLHDRFAPGGLLHFGQGKWYPGESLPRWAFACYFRKDGQPVWHDKRLIADATRDDGFGPEHARRFADHLADAIGVERRFITPAYEDAMYYAWKEHRLPPNVTAGQSRVRDEEERRRLARVFEQGLNTPRGYVMPLQRPWWQASARWATGFWPVRSEQMFLLPGDSPMGLRLPLDSLSYIPAGQMPVALPLDPTVARPPLPAPLLQRLTIRDEGELTRDDLTAGMGGEGGVGVKRRRAAPRERTLLLDAPALIAHAPYVVRTALCVEPRDGRLHVFMPPVDLLEDYLDLVACIEHTAATLNMPVIVEGYLPPTDPRLSVIRATPDPGVIEVNIHPASQWDEMVEHTTALYEEARLARLGTEKFDLDGKHSGTGGGNHVVLGGPTPLDSPFLRRPDLLASLVTYWQHHPSLSYLFSGRFIGPTSQSPRVDEGRADALYELEIALRLVREETARWGATPPWLVDRLFRHLLTDLTGNTHRAEVCIDKLYSPDSASGRLGLVELRGFEMPPHAQMSLTQQMLIRALVAHFWRHPVTRPPVAWGTALHDRFMLPYFLGLDLADVLEDLRRDGIDIDPAWFDTHVEFRCPKIGQFAQRGIHVTLRHAIEPWYVLGEEPAGGGTSRAVDSSVERLQVLVDGMTDERHAVTVNGRRVPLHPTGVTGQYVAGVRYRAWQPPRCLHPTIGVHTPLVFDLVDTWQGRSIGGAVYHVSNPAGQNTTVFPVNALEAESRRAARFFRGGHTPGPMQVVDEPLNPRFPMTLDLRWLRA